MSYVDSEAARDIGLGQVVDPEAVAAFVAAQNAMRAGHTIEIAGTTTPTGLDEGRADTDTAESIASRESWQIIPPHIREIGKAGVKAARQALEHRPDAA